MKKRAPDISKLPSMGELQARRTEQFRRTLRGGIARLKADRDACLIARIGRGPARAIGGTASGTDLLGSALRYEIRTVIIDVIAAIYAAIQPASAREKAVNAFIETFREQIAAKAKEAEQ
jgi:hypothetical protein